MTGPYAQAAGDYWSAGWRGVLPLPPRAKKNPPGGERRPDGTKGVSYTGKAGIDPSFPDLMTWAEGPEGEGNIALRMPATALGLDVDAYGDKRGAETLASGERQWGELPPTWRTTSRDDGVSGIRLYRIPPGLRWPGTFGPGTEIVRRGHRYAVAPPSIHPEGRTYRWITPEGLTSTTGPRPEDLPELPSSWLVALTEGRLEDDSRKADLDDEVADDWIAEHDHGDTECPVMYAAIGRTIADLEAGIGHETLGRLPGILRLGVVGHPGLRIGLDQIEAAFLREVTRAGRSSERDQREAEGEWRRSLTGAVQVVVGDPRDLASDQDPCDPVHLGELAASSPVPEPVESGLRAATEEETGPSAPGKAEDEPVDDTEGQDTEDEDQAEQESDAGPTPEQLYELRVQAEVAEQRRRRDALRRLQAEDAPPLRVLSFADFRDAPRPEPVVPGVFYRDSLSRIFGAPGCGKSFLGMDLACHIALGMDWRDEKVERGPVVYVMAEGQAVNVLRVEAWCERNKVDPDELEGHFYAVPDAVALTEEGVRDLVRFVAEVRPALIVLDTKNAMMVGEENSATDTAAMRRGLDALRKAAGSCVVLIDHTGHEGTRARGSSAATAAMDTELRVTKGDGSPPLITAEVTRDKAAEAGRQWRWHLRMSGGAAALVATELAEGEPLDGDLEWTEAAVAVPTDLLHFEGAGARAMPDLARFMASEASSRDGDPSEIGASRADAERALAKRGHAKSTVRRAWSALIEQGRIDPASGVKAPTGRHVWNP